jgi:hypothetical protein
LLYDLCVFEFVLIEFCSDRWSPFHYVFLAIGMYRFNDSSRISIFIILPRLFKFHMNKTDSASTSGHGLKKSWVLLLDPSRPIRGYKSGRN